MIIHYLSYFENPELFVNQFFAMVIGQGILAVYWFRQGQKEKAWWWTITAEAMITGVILTLRQDIPLLFEVPWPVDWDMTIGLFAAFAITATQPLLKHQDRSIRIPIRFTLFGLPLATLMYALNNYAVSFEFFSQILLPIYSVLFLFQALGEKDRFVLAYAFLGINSYLILLLLHNQIQSLQAYITPVCISVLILVQVFRDLTTRTTANFVRGGALLILFGVSMFQTLAENSLSPTAHLIIIVLSSLAIIVAGLLHIRIFAAMGLFCFILDLIAIIYIVLSRQETEILKVILGIGLTVGGGLVLTGYILYRQNKARVEEVIGRLKKTFYSWE